ncbi:hypothetical protein AALB47_26030 [Lachnospiraceae bacterium 54-11]
MKKDIVFFDDPPEELNPELYKPHIDPAEEKRLEEEEKQKKREERRRRLLGRKG